MRLLKWILLLHLSYFRTVQSQVQSRIVGGTTTTIDTVPFVLNLRRSGSFICGASLLDNRTAITAAHCVEGYAAGNFTVVGGSTYVSETTTSSKVSTIIKSTNYNAGTKHMDVAILKLATPFTAIKTIGLCNGAIPVGASVKLAGWGLTNANGQISEQLRTVNVTMLSRVACAKAYENITTLTSSMMCASQQGKDSCAGDSGGPLIYGNSLCGIISFGVGCANESYPGVYTNINAVQTFIAAARQY